MQLEELKECLGTTYYSETGGWTVEPQEDALMIHWDPDEGRTTVSGMPESGDVTEVFRFSGLLAQTGTRAAIMQTLAQRERNHPRKWGLVRAGLPPHQGQLGYSTHLAGSFDIPTDEKGHGYGWFSPDADPQEFGTLFTYPHALIGETTADETVEWRIGQVGIANSVLATALWSDNGSCATLMSRVRENDLAANLVMTALTADPTEMRSAARRQLHRGDSIKARRLFAPRRMRIQPRLVGDRVKQAIFAMTPEWSATLNDNKINRSDGALSLDAWELRLGYVKPLNVGYLIRFCPRTGYATGALLNGAQQVALTHYDPYAAVLQPLLDERNLGNIYRYQVGHDVFLLVSQNIEGAMRVPGAFNMFDDPKVEKYTGAPGALWEPVGRPSDYEQL